MLSEVKHLALEED